jgi:hypothetical protein
MKKILFALAFLLAGLTSEQAPAQQLVKLCSGQPCVVISSGNPLPISGSFSATLTGFTPGGTYATLTATNASASVALPLGTTVAFQNSGTTTVSCTLGVGSATAAASEILIGAATTVFITPGSNTFGACIDQTGSASNLVVLAGGSGLGTGYAPSGSVVTQGTSPWVESVGFWNGVALGSPSNYGTSPGAVSVPGVNAFVTNVPAVSQSGTWNVTVNAALPVGTNLLGKVGIDQTTAGTTNGVALVGVNAATALAGAGATGTGSARVTAAQDTTTIAGSAPGTAGSPSPNVVSIQGVSSGTTVPVSGTVSNNNAVNVTLTDCSGTVATGGTAVNAFTAQTTLHGFTILNTNTSEVMWISFTTTAAASTAGSYPLAPATATTFAGAGSFTSPPGMGTNHALSVVAATSAHTFSCTWW